MNAVAISRLNSDVVAILNQTATRTRLETAGFEPQLGSPHDVEVLIHDGMDRWGKLIKELKLQAD